MNDDFASDAAAVLDQLPLGVFWRDEQARFAGFNSYLRRLFPNLALDEAIGRTLNEINFDVTDFDYDAVHWSVMESGQQLGESPMEVHLDGEVVRVRRTVVPLRDKHGVVRGTATVLEDRSDHQRLEQQLVQAQKLESVGQLAAGIAHEINTPMQYIGDNTHFLKNTVTRLLTIAQAAQTATQPNATDEDKEHLTNLLAKSKLPMLTQRAPKAADDALTGVENVSRIVTAMKRFSHPGSTELGPVDLNESITTTMTVCRNEWKYAANITTNFGDIPTIQGHLGELNQVWLNMIVNAAHALTERHGTTKGNITITTTTPDPNHAQITITDNGAGIKKEHLDKVLDPFFTTKEVGKGTGQGLAIAHQVITKAHHGTLTVQSTKNEGTTFTITLPTQPPTGATPTEDTEIDQ